MPEPPRRTGDRAPVRIVHLGLGAFHRAHQAWYTAHSDPAGEWGIAAFTGRSPAAAATLARQDDVYTVLTRAADGDHLETIESIVATHDGADTDALRGYLARPEVTVVTLTVTEKGYRQDPEGRLDRTDPEVTADLLALRSAFAEDDTRRAVAVSTMPGRLVWGLDARRRVRPHATITLIPCDNLPDNGTVLRTVLHDLAATVSLPLAAWIDTHVDVVSTSVDRITPRATADDIERATARTGVRDEALVVTEPFHSWILSGRIRGERPRWEDAGAAFVADIEPFEQRKLWMLNGAHSLLAYEGLDRGKETVAEAIADRRIATRVEALWDLDEAVLRAHAAELDLAAYRRSLLTRFANPAIVHRLRQIAADGSVKLPARVVDPIRRARTDGVEVEAAVAVLAAWTRFVVAETGAGRPLDDVAADELSRRAASADPHLALLALLAPDLAADPGTVACFTSLVAT